MSLTVEQIEAAGIKGGKGYPHDWLSEPRPEVVEKVRLWILEHCQVVEFFPRILPRSSYGWKHIAEKEIGEYVANGEFIVAALLAGAQAKPEAPGALNARFTLKLSKEKKSAGYSLLRR